LVLEPRRPNVSKCPVAFISGTTQLLAQLRRQIAPSGEPAFLGQDFRLGCWLQPNRAAWARDEAFSLADTTLGHFSYCAIVERSWLPRPLAERQEEAGPLSEQWVLLHWTVNISTADQGRSGCLLNWISGHCCGL
jgi:hypothetical protein